MRKIYSFGVDFGRNGEIDGMFIAESDNVENIIGKNVDFGEALGKHSDVQVVMEESYFTILSDELDFIEKFEKIIGTGSISGYNPLDYLD